MNTPNESFYREMELMETRDSLEVTVKGDEEAPIIELSGKVADAEVKKFQRKIDQLYKKRYATIIVDVSRASFMDSHGLGTIVYYHTLMQKEKRKLVIVNTNADEGSYLNRLFSLTNLDKVLNLQKA
ncbi:MAG: STAS domain-containing protein [Chitinispirillaceae bacterium]|nr:STAS domain-containing protein [Chitinispirillaceae bacterium]